MACCIRRIHVDVFFNIVGLTAGFGGFIAFNFCFYNYEAGLLALFAGILASVGLHLHRLYAEESLRDWYTIDIFRSIQVLAFIGILVGIGFIGWNTFSQLYYNYAINPFYKSKLMSIVWAFMNFVFGFHLFFTLRRYSRFSDGYQSIN